MNICSLLPGATEIVAALGLTKHLVGISHECDFPPEVRKTPVMVNASFPTEHRSSLEIDEQVRETVASGNSLYTLDKELFVQARPDVVITQGLCHVCALTPKQVEEAIQCLPHIPQLLSLNPTNLDGVLSDIERIGAATHRVSQATDLHDALSARIHGVTQKLSQTDHHPRVACIEWFDPLYVAGHWVPEMVTLAGGIDVFGTKDEPSTIIDWDDLVQASPDIIVFMPCGFSVERSREEFGQVGNSLDWSTVPAIQSGKAFVVDASSYFSRPGPRLIDGLEILASILHPSLFGPRPSHQVQPLIAPVDHAHNRNP